MKKCIPFLFAIASFILFSCGGDDSGEDCASLSINFAEEFSTELQAIFDTGASFGTDPSQSNCEAYKEAIQNYIEALKNFEDCAEEAGLTTEWNQAINEYDVNLLNSIC